MARKYEDPSQNPKYCGEVFAVDLDRMIPVYHRTGESCEDALVRVEALHKPEGAAAAMIDPSS
jgi:hypothetical protein